MNFIPNQQITYSSLVFVVIGIAGGYLISYQLQYKSVSEKSSHRKKLRLIGTKHPSTALIQYKDCVYLDYNATTPIFPEVSEAMLPFITQAFGNPSSSHIYAIPCKKAIDKARDNVGALINAKNPQKNIFFTSCGTESDNGAIDIAIHHFKKRTLDKHVPHIVTSSIEHPAVINYLRSLEAEGLVCVTVAPVDSEGFLVMDSFRSSLSVYTALVTIMHSNNEVGTIQHIREITRIIRQFNRENGSEILFHVDAAQSLGKVRVDVDSNGIDLLSIVGHKFGAPKGVAALYIREGITYKSLLVGGGQERGLRAGTESVLLIVGLGEACRIALQEADDALVHMLSLKLRFLTSLVKAFNDTHDSLIRFNGPKRSSSVEAIESDLKILRTIVKTSSHREENDRGDGTTHGALAGAVVDQLPNTLSVSFRGLSAQTLLHHLFDKVACSAGSACHSSGDEKVSPVLEAMGASDEYALGTLRFSWGRHTTIEEIDAAVVSVANTVHSLINL